METNTITVRVFRVKAQHRTGEDWKFARKISDRYNFTHTVDPLEADNMMEADADTLVGHYSTIQDHMKNGEKIELVDVEITSSIRPIDLDSGEFLEIRRKRALNKLNDSDVAALGIEKLATYNKLKFHNGDE